MKYTFSYENPNSHYINIEVELKLETESKVQFQLPAWRPGRYELGNFAKNIQKWAAFDENGKQLKHSKITKDLWQVECKGAKKVVVQYNYFATDLNAGSTFLNQDQLYVNPVNCCLYAIGREEDSCELLLKVPNNYRVATSMTSKSNFHFETANFDELADSPFIASASLQMQHYTINNTVFYVWFQGIIKGDFKQLIKDFKSFSKEQGKLFKGFPFKEYHFLFQILPYKAYHGVEHANSTVIALGPSYEVLKKDTLYDELLGVSSHELFHAWNVKRIRPIEMWPYDFTQENYSRLGYLAEGATTWYGDLMLYRSKVFDDASFLKTFSQLMNRHYNNPGATNLSVADSSFDTWLDGYDKGVPNRKASIYTEGALITFLLDIEIRRSTGDHFSFDDVMRIFYTNFYEEGKGVSEADYQKAVEHFAQLNMHSFFKKYVNGAQDFTKELKKALDYLGLELVKKPRENYHESYLGFVCDENDTVVQIYPNSPAEKAGMSVADEVVFVNGIKAKGCISDWCKFYKEDEIILGMVDQFAQYKSLKMKVSKELAFALYDVKKVSKPSKSQQNAFKEWLKS